MTMLGSFPGIRTRNLHFDSYWRSKSIMPVECARPPQNLAKILTATAISAIAVGTDHASTPVKFECPSTFVLLLGVGGSMAAVDIVYRIEGINQFGMKVREQLRTDGLDFRFYTKHAYSVVTKAELLHKRPAADANTVSLVISGRDTSGGPNGGILGETGTKVALPFYVRRPEAIKGMFNLAAIEPTWDTAGAVDPVRRWYVNDEDDFTQSMWAGISAVDGVEWRPIGFVGDGTTGSDASWSEEEARDYTPLDLIDLDHATIRVPVYTSATPLRYVIAVNPKEIIRAN